LPGGLQDIQCAFGVIQYNRSRNIVELAQGINNVEACIETCSLVEASMIGYTVHVALAEGFLEGIATIIYRAKEFPLNKREMLVDTLFE
jgi:hypothetical protein